MCERCGCIDDRNRQTQEVFCCIECGHSENADIHSAKNIKFRLTSTVLRGNLLERAGEALVETRYEEDIDLVEEIITAKVVSVDTPPKLKPHKVIINMDKPIRKYY